MSINLVDNFTQADFPSSETAPIKTPPFNAGDIVAQGSGQGGKSAKLSDAITDFTGAITAEIVGTSNPVPNSSGTPAIAIQKAFASLDQGERADFFTAILAHAEKIDGGRNVNEALIEAMEGTGSSVVTRAQMGETVREAFYSGAVSASDLARLVTAGDSTGSGAADVFEASGNTRLMSEVSRAIVDQTDNLDEPAVKGDIRGEAFGTAVVLVKSAADNGDPSPARSLFDQLFAGNSLREKLVSDVMDHSDDGLTALVSLTNTLDQSYAVREDVSETIFQEILINGGDSSNLRGNPDVLSGLNTYFDNNLDRLFSEALEPRTPTLDPQGNDRPFDRRLAFASKEEDDGKILSQFISNVTLNPEAEPAEVATTISRLGDKIESALERTSQTDLSDKERLDAAEAYGLGIGSFDDGLVRFVAAAAERRSGPAEIGATLIDIVAAFIPAVPSAAGKLVEVLSDQAKTEVLKAIKSNLGEVFPTDREGAEMVKQQFEGVVNAGGIALLPEDSAKSPEPLSRDLELAYTQGYNAAERPIRLGG